MKNLSVLSFCFIFCFSSLVVAQDKTYGIKGGYLLGNFWGDGSEDLNNQLNAANSSIDEQNLNWFAISFFSERELLPDFFSVQSELVYLRNGKQWEGTFNGESKKFQVYADYLQMPWLVKIALPVFLKPSIYFGPNISWMIRSRVKDIPSSIDSIQFFAGKDPGGQLFERYTNVIDLVLTTGLDFDYQLGPGSIVFDFRFNLGALNMYNFASGDKIRNYNFIFMAGYSFDFSGGY